MHTIGTGLKVWREGKKLKQPEAATLLGVPPSTYQKYEMDIRAPGAEAIECFVRAGINANWLLTGEGPMMLADLVTPAAVVEVKPARPEISFVALAQALSAMQATARAGESPMDTARKAVEFYQFMDEKGLVTLEGFSQGEMDSAA